MKWTIGDIGVCVLVLTFTGLLYYLFFMAPANGTGDAIVTVNSKDSYRFTLSDIQSTQDTAIDANGYHVVIRTELGKIRFLTADCPDQVCVHTGWLSAQGRMAACVPANVVVRIEGNSSDIDVVLE